MTDEVRADPQPEDGQGARADDPAVGAALRRRGHSVTGRRTLAALVVIAGALGVPLGGDAQPPGKVVRVAALSAGVPRSGLPWVAFEKKLRELGYVDGQNLAFDYRNTEGRSERVPALAAELVQLKPDVIVSGGSEPVIRGLQQAAGTIPIVMVAVDYDPIARGYVAGLARPGGNITGVFLQQVELSAKRIEIMKETLPRVTRATAFWDVFSADQFKAAATAARSVGIQLDSVELKNAPYDYEAAFATALRSRPGGLFVCVSPVFFRDRSRIAELALKHRLPAIFGLSAWVEAGGLIGYGANLSDMFRTAAVYVDKVLKGEKPANLPVEQPTKFELVLNLKTAKALGLTIPPSVRLRADQVLE
jgi:putative ABC transport system substrate-binding protein